LSPSPAAAALPAPAPGWRGNSPANTWQLVATNPDGSVTYQNASGGTRTLAPDGRELSREGDQETNGLGLPSLPSADLSGVKKAQADAFGLTQALGAERAGYVGAYDPNQRTQLYDQQQQNIAGLTAIANGTAPSAAEIQLRSAAGRGEAGQFGLAAALQGRNPGAALRSARIGAANVLGQANEQAAAVRAQEQARAQSELAQALAGMQAANANFRAQDIGEKGQLLGGETTALGHEVTAATGGAAASAANAAGKNALLGGVLSGTGQIFAARQSSK
jgi:hypothetical protein